MTNGSRLLRRWVKTAMMAGGLAAVAQAGAEAQLPAGFSKVALTTKVAGTGLVFSPDTTDKRLFIATKSGTIRVFDYGAGILRNPAYAKIEVSVTGLQGLLGITLDPGYPTLPYVYVYYITGPGSLNYSGTPTPRLSRLTGAGDVMDAGSEKIILELPTGNAGHNGGALHFSPDGQYLFLAVGDGGTKNNARNLAILRGKILRIKINSDGTYAVPPDNPFVSTPGARPEIWSYGHRNPFSFTFRPSNGAMILAEAGHASWEELDVVERGSNYGWSGLGYEGPCLRHSPDCTPPPCPPCDRNPTYPDSLAYPIFFYRDPGVGASAVAETEGEDGEPTATGVGTGSGGGAIIGGEFVHGGNYPPQFQGKYVFADYVMGWVHLLTFDPSLNRVTAEETFDQLTGPTAFARNPSDGNLYVADRPTSTIFKYVYSDGS